MSSILTFGRIRPKNDLETGLEPQDSLVTDYKSTICLISPGCPNGSRETFWMDRVFSEKDSQERVYLHCGVPLLDVCAEGYNSTLFAYGQTGTGKTYTILGTAEAPGLLPRIVQTVFKRFEFLDLRCSYVEIYQDKIRDLLNPGHELSLSIHPITGVMLPDMKVVEVSSPAAGLELLKVGSDRREVHATQMNAVSSRSHTLFTLYMGFQRETGEAVTTKLTLIDLAGRENEKTTLVKRDRMKELKAINMSLFSLGLLIRNMGNGRRRGSAGLLSGFRDSKLNLLLAESLTGNAKTAMIAGLTYCGSAYEENLTTLRLIRTIKHIRTSPIKARVQNTASDSRDLEREVQQYINQIEDLQLKEKQVVQSEAKLLKAQQQLAKDLALANVQTRSYIPDDPRILKLEDQYLAQIRELKRENEALDAQIREMREETADMDQLSKKNPPLRTESVSVELLPIQPSHPLNCFQSRTAPFVEPQGSGSQFFQNNRKISEIYSGNLPIYVKLNRQMAYMKKELGIETEEDFQNNLEAFLQTIEEKEWRASQRLGSFKETKSEFKERVLRGISQNSCSHFGSNEAQTLRDTLKKVLAEPIPRNSLFCRTFSSKDDSWEEGENPGVNSFPSSQGTSNPLLSLQFISVGVSAGLPTPDFPEVPLPTPPDFPEVPLPTVRSSEPRSSLQFLDTVAIERTFDAYRKSHLEYRRACQAKSLELTSEKESATAAQAVIQRDSQQIRGVHRAALRLARKAEKDMKKTQDLLNERSREIDELKNKGITDYLRDGVCRNQ